MGINRFVLFGYCIAGSIGSLAAAPGNTSPREITNLKVITDSPDQWVGEISSGPFAILPAGDGKRVHCAGCGEMMRPGAPDLPVYRFNVLMGSESPQGEVQILSAETQILSEDVAAYPSYITPDSSTRKPDAASFLSAAACRLDFLPVRSLRGFRVQGVAMPMALWDAKTRTLTCIRKARLRIAYGSRSRIVFPGSIPASVLPEILNPVGGAYLGARLTRAHPALAKTGPATDQLGVRFYALRIGDRKIDSQDEDQWYGLAFTDFQKAGSDINGARVADLRMYCGPNDTIPRRMNSEVSPGRLREIPIEVLDKDGDGTFDAGDSLRFFGHGTEIWKRLTRKGPIGFEFSSDPYSFDNTYYLDFSPTGKSGPALRYAEASGLPEGQALSPTGSSYAYLRAQKDAQAGTCDVSGNKDEEAAAHWYWYWKGKCKGGDTTITLTRAMLQTTGMDSLPDLEISSSDAPVFIGFYAPGILHDQSFRPFFQGHTLRFAAEDAASSGSYFAWTGALSHPAPLPLDSLVWSDGHAFDGYTVVYRRSFRFTGKPLWIFPEKYGARTAYRIGNGARLHALRVESGVATRRFDLNSEGIFLDSLDAGSDARYYLYRDDTPFPLGNLSVTGLPDSKAAIRDLTNGDGLDPEYLILAPDALLGQAGQLRDFRNDGHRALRVKTAVVRLEDIYRQYSGGRMSPIAIRDFLRWAYGQWGASAAGDSRLQYVLLFGDGNYDYRGIRAMGMKSAPPNLIPPYEFDSGLDNNELATDDFYAALDSADNDLGSAGLDLAIGRLPVQTASEGEAYLRKIKAYEDPALAGDWRGRVTFAADDGTQRGNTGNLDGIKQGHTTSSDQLANLISAQETGVAADKIYLLDYPLNSSFHKPEAAQDLLALMNRGTLLVNFVGHGASNQWADEVLLQTSDALARLHNQGRLPMLNAFSCTVGRFESLTSEGMSEQFVKQSEIGAIAAISATRETFADYNIDLAGEFYRRAFPPDSSGRIVTVGQALMAAKNSPKTPNYLLNDAKYALLGEPVLLLRKPQLVVSLTKTPDTLKALDCNTLQGRITGGGGEGFVNVKIVAGSTHIVYRLPTPLDSQVVDKRGNILFERTLPYHDFKFETEYFIPKAISFGDTNALIQAFAWDAREEREGSGAVRGLRIQGTASGPCATDKDGRGPTIAISGCRAKETGEVDFPDHVKLALPFCLQISVRDSLGGVLTAEGPGAGTTLEIPGSVEPFHPSPGTDELYFKTYQYSLTRENIAPGSHLLKVTAQDGYGNFSVRQLNFDATLDSSINLLAAYNVPNPMKRKGTTFYFSGALPAPDLSYGDAVDTADRVEFEIRIFNQSGHLVRTFPNAHSGLTAWDGRDQWGQLLGNGVYFYQVNARQSAATAGGSRPGYRTLASRRNTLIISR